jgi:signal transduction histidine kinase
VYGFRDLLLFDRSKFVTFNVFFTGKGFPKLLVYDSFFYHIKILYLTLTLIACSASGAVAQNPKIDSLKNAIESGKGKEKLNPLLALVRVYGAIDNQDALRYARQANSLAMEFGDTIAFVTSSRMMGQLLNRLSMNKEAEEVLLRALPIAERYNLKNDYLTIMSNLAIAYTYQARYDKALGINFQALALREAAKEYHEMSLLQNNIGVVYFKLKNYQKALEYYERAIKLKKEISDNHDLDRLLINTGLTYNALKKYSKALEYFKTGFETCGENCRGEIVVEGRFGQGISRFELGDFKAAEIDFEKSLEIARQIGYERFQAENLLNLARIFLREKRYSEVPATLLDCEGIAVKNRYGEILIEVYREFATLYNRTTDFQKASFYQEKYISIKDSIYSSELIDNLTKIETDYAERENKKTIADKEQVIQQQRNITIAIIIIAILAALLVFVLYRSNQTKKKVNAALSEAKAIIEEQNKLLTSSNIHLDKELKERNIDLEKANVSLRQVNEELDNFIYKTSHDIRGPLASLKGMCNVALIDVQDPIALGYLHKLDITADKMNTILTRLVIVNQINNSVVGYEHIDFNEIINDVLLLEKKKGLPLGFTILRDVAEEIEFSSDREFIRIILENLINNAIKFYNDSGKVKPFVKISVREENHRLSIKVVDNGIGISKVDPVQIFHMFSRASERSETGGIGLYITKTAVEKLGGKIELRTNHDGHTEFGIWLPMQQAKVTV